MMIEMLGAPPDRIFDNPEHATEYFNITPDDKYELKTYEQYSEASE